MLWNVLFKKFKKICRFFLTLYIYIYIIGVYRTPKTFGVERGIFMTDYEKQVEVNEEKEYTPFEALATVKKFLLVFGGACVLSVAALLVSNIFMLFDVYSALFGLAIFGFLAAPVLLVFLTKFGATVDMGPVFVEHKVIIGNTIYYQMVRDEFQEVTQNVVASFGKILLFTVLSIIITPVLAVAGLIAYFKCRKDAFEYADQNGISRSDVPVFDKKKLMIIGIVLAAMFVFVAIGNVAQGIARDAEESKISSDIEKTFNSALENLPEEYYAKTKNMYKGYVTAFKLDDGTMVYGGQVFDTEEQIAEYESLEYGCYYYIINDTLYVCGYDLGDEFEVVNDKKTKEFLIGRHLHKIVDGKLKFTEGDYWDRDETCPVYGFTNGSYIASILTNEDGSLYAFSRLVDPSSSYTDVTFYLEEYDVWYFKKEAAKLIESDE